MNRTYAQRYGAEPFLRIFDDLNSAPDNSASWHADAIAAARTVADLMGYEPYCNWIDAQEWQTWREFHGIVSAKLDTITADECDCNGANRDVCPECAHLAERLDGHYDRPMVDRVMDGPEY